MKIPVLSFYKEYKNNLGLSIIAGQNGLFREIKDKTVNRPALALAGYFSRFSGERLQFLGRCECGYLREMSKSKQKESLENFMSFDLPCIVIVKNEIVPKLLIELANKRNITIFRTSMNSQDFMTEATWILNKVFAKTSVIHGTLVDIKGIGVLLIGESGTGKTECALSLIERGYTLVSDDSVKLVALSNHAILGSSLPMNKGFIECRGIGIINIIKMFGARAFCPEKYVDLVVNLIAWQAGIEEERLGLDDKYYDLLGSKIPFYEIPVRLGRDTSRLVEIAALDQILKQLGYNSSKEFNISCLRNMKSNSI